MPKLFTFFGKRVSAQRQESDGRVLLPDGSINVNKLATDTKLYIEQPWHRNYLINGGFEFWQRQGPSMQDIGGDGTYRADRWRQSGDPGPNLNQAGREIFPFGTAPIAAFGEIPFYYHWQATNYTGTGIAVRQIIEDVRTLAGQKAVFSFYAKANNTPFNIRIQIKQISDAGFTSSYDVLNTIQTISTSWQRYVFFLNIPSDTYSLWSFGDGHGLAVIFVLCDPSGGEVINNNWDFCLTGVSLIRGEQVVPFSYAGGTITGELQLCQRYFEKSYSLDTPLGTPSQPGFMINQGFVNYVVTFNTKYSVSKRTIPNVKSYSYGTGVSDKIYPEGSADIDAEVLTYNAHSHIIKSTASVPTTTFYYIHWSADAEIP